MENVYVKNHYYEKLIEILDELDLRLIETEYKLEDSSHDMKIELGNKMRAYNLLFEQIEKLSIGEEE